MLVSKIQLHCTQDQGFEGLEKAKLLLNAEKSSSGGHDRTPTPPEKEAGSWKLSAGGTNDRSPADYRNGAAETANQADDSEVLVFGLRLHRRWGLALYGLSTVFLAFQSVSGKILGQRGFPSYELVLARSLVILLFSCVSIYFDDMNFFGKRKYLLWFRGSTGFGSILTMYYAIEHMQLSDAMVLTFLAPLFVCLLAPLVLKEPFQREVLLALPICSVAVVLISKPAFLFGKSQTAVGALAISAGLLQPCSSAAAKMTVRALGKTETAGTIIFYQGFVSTIGGIILCSAVRQGMKAPKNPGQLLLLFATGFCGYCSQVCLTASLKVVNAAPATALSYLSVVWGEISGQMIFHEKADVLSIMGAFLICSSSLLLGLSARTKEEASQAIVRHYQHGRDAVKRFGQEIAEMVDRQSSSRVPRFARLEDEEAHTGGTEMIQPPGKTRALTWNLSDATI